MENQIIIGKRFVLEKLKESPLRIPISFRIAGAKINIITTSETNQFPVKLDFIIADSLSETKPQITMPVLINNKETVIYPKTINAFEANKNYLLLSFKADKPVMIELSISIL